MTTTLQPPYRFVQNGHSFTGTARWDVFSTITDEYLGYTAHATSKRNGTIWHAATPDGKRIPLSFRSREGAASGLEEARDAQA